MTMQILTCQQARDQLDTLEPAELLAPPEPLASHLLDCPDCRAVRAYSLSLRRQLHSLPVAPPSAGYQARMQTLIRSAAPPARRNSRLPAYAMAASLALSVGLALLLDRSPSPSPALDPAAAVALQGHLQPVRLVFNSPRNLRGVSLTVVLPDGAELSSHPGLRELSWTTDLQAGANVLELPVLVRAAGGPVLATLRYGNAERNYSVALKPLRQSDRSPSSHGSSSLPSLDFPRVTT